MTGTVERTGQAVENDLMNWMQAVTEPDVCIEEYVDGDRHVVRIDIPGVNPGRDLELSVHEGVLRLHGERRSETHDQHRTEIRYGSFERVVTLPPGTTAQDVEAAYVDGVLTVSMPRESPAHPEAHWSLESETGSHKVPVAHWSLGAN